MVSLELKRRLKGLRRDLDAHEIRRRINEYVLELEKAVAVNKEEVSRLRVINATQAHELNHGK